MSRRKKARRKGRLLLAFALVALICLLFFRCGSGGVAETIFPRKYAVLIEHYAAENQLPADLVYAIVYCESGFDPDAVSSVGARGLMQLMEPTFDWVKNGLDGEEDTVYDDMFDPKTNLKYGCRLLGLLLQEYETIPNALCGYHAGWGITRQWLEDPQYAPDGKNIENIPYDDTASYVKKVMRTAKIYHELYHL